MKELLKPEHLHPAKKVKDIKTNVEGNLMQIMALKCMLQMNLLYVAINSVMCAGLHIHKIK